jgi:hypothetical protein
LRWHGVIKQIDITKCFYGYVGGSYKLLAKESPPKAVLLLHGLNSDVSTWNALKDKEFNIAIKNSLACSASVPGASCAQRRTASLSLASPVVANKRAA